LLDEFQLGLHPPHPQQIRRYFTRYYVKFKGARKM